MHSKQKTTWPNHVNLSNKQLAYQLSFKCQSFHCEESSLYLACSQYLTLKSLYSGTSRFFSFVNLTEWILDIGLPVVSSQFFLINMTKDDYQDMYVSGQFTHTQTDTHTHTHTHTHAHTCSITIQDQDTSGPILWRANSPHPPHQSHLSFKQ